MERLNKVQLSGQSGEVVFSHECFGKYYYRFTLTNVRSSGVTDNFPVVIEDSVIKNNEYEGKEVLVTGVIRSMDTSKNPKKHHNVNYIAADAVEILDEPVPEGDINKVELIARNCTKEPYVKITPLSRRKVSNLFLAIPREKYPNRSDFIGCTVWGKGADLAETVKRNDFVKITGRLMSRDVLVSENETETVYEVSVRKMEVLENESRSEEDHAGELQEISK